MIIKYIGGAVLVAIGWITGESICLIFKQRSATLERFKSFVLFCENEVTFFKTEMNMIIDKFREEKNKYDELLFDTNNKDFIITKELRVFINDFFSQVVRLDTENQKYYFAEVKRRIETFQNKARSEEKIKGQTLKKLLPILALGIFILTL